MAIRLALLYGHYRSDREWTDDILVRPSSAWPPGAKPPARRRPGRRRTIAAVRAALAGDLDPPTALAAVDAWAGAAVAIGSDDTDAPVLVARPSTPCSVSGSRSVTEPAPHTVGIGVSHGVSYIPAHVSVALPSGVRSSDELSTRACTGVGVSPNRR